MGFTVSVGCEAAGTVPLDEELESEEQPVEPVIARTHQPTPSSLATTSPQPTAGPHHSHIYSGDLAIPKMWALGVYHFLRDGRTV